MNFLQKHLHDKIVTENFTLEQDWTKKFSELYYINGYNFIKDFFFSFFYTNQNYFS